MLYIAPETLLNPEVQELIQEYLTVSFIAIDEAHVLSNWGNSFRPKYRQLSSLKSIWDVPIIALTATLNNSGIDEVVSVLKMNKPNKFIHNVDRPSIQYNIFRRLDGKKQTLSIIQSYPKSTFGIVYAGTRAKTEDMALWLQSKGIKCEAFHAGLPKKVKLDILERYLNGSLKVIVATIAFGMGIDKPDIRYCIHVDSPTNMEAYMQESGRLSRDGIPSEAYLLFDESDTRLKIFLATKCTKDPSRLQNTINTIKSFARFCEDTSSCRRKKMLEFFDQSPDKCDNCDICLGHTSILDSITYKRMSQSK